MKKTILFLLLICLNGIKLVAQEVDATPGTYYTAMFKTHREMDEKYMAYTSAVAHGKRARKVEKLRQQVLESITNTRYKVIDLPKYKGDNSLRQSNLDYIDFCYKIFNEDYAQIVNTEEIAEQSFDQMQAYLLFKDKVKEKLKQATKSVNQASKDFAKKYNLNLVEGEKDELGEKMEQANKVSEYYNPIFLIYFKCNWQDEALTKALKEKKINDAEQARISVIKYANEGLAELEKIPVFQGDGSLKQACKQLLQGLKSVAEKETLQQTDFILKNENFEKIKKSFENKDQDSRTKEDVDAYNKAVKDINAAVNISNQASTNAYNKRVDIYKNWEETVNTFFDTNTPKYR